MNATERYLFTLRAAEAALKAYAAAPSYQTFLLACEAVNDHQDAHKRFVEVYSKGSNPDPFETPADT